jgi:hypothetical protein
VGIPKNQLVYFPKGDLTKGKLVCEASRMTPATFGIDQRDRIGSRMPLVTSDLLRHGQAGRAPQIGPARVP